MRLKDYIMHWNTIEDVTATMDIAILGKLCVQVWLGIGNVLFIGFGEVVLPPPLPSELHKKPPYELQTDFANWWVESSGRIIGSNTNEREVAESAATLLVGHRVADWCFENGTVALAISFSDGLKLRMAPFDDCDIAEHDAWVLRGPEYYGFMQWNGTIGDGRCDHYFLDE